MNKEQYYELPLHEQNLIDRKMTQEEYDVLPGYEQSLVDKGLPTLAETKEYRKTVEWVPYEQYMKQIFHHCPGREHDGFNMQQNWFDKRLEPDKLLREAAYLYGLKYRSTCDDKWHEWSENDQKVLEEKLYIMFKEVVGCYK